MAYRKTFLITAQRHVRTTHTQTYIKIHTLLCAHSQTPLISHHNEKESFSLTELLMSLGKYVRMWLQSLFCSEKQSH